MRVPYALRYTAASAYYISKGCPQFTEMISNLKVASQEEANFLHWLHSSTVFALAFLLRGKEVNNYSWTFFPFGLPFFHYLHSPSVYHFSTISIYLNMSMGWLFSKVLGSSSFERQLVFLIKTILFGKRQMRRTSLEVKSLGYQKLQPLQQPLPFILPQRFDALACKLRYFSYVTARGMKEKSDQNL